MADKIAEANLLLLNETYEDQREVRVKFRDVIADYEPDLTDDDVQSIESYNEIDFSIIEDPLEAFKYQKDSFHDTIYETEEEDDDEDEGEGEGEDEEESKKYFQNKHFLKKQEELLLKKEDFFRRQEEWSEKKNLLMMQEEYLSKKQNFLRKREDEEDYCDLKNQDFLRNQEDEDDSYLEESLRTQEDFLQCEDHLSKKESFLKTRDKIPNSEIFKNQDSSKFNKEEDNLSGFSSEIDEKRVVIKFQVKNNEDEIEEDCSKEDDDEENDSPSISYDQIDKIRYFTVENEINMRRNQNEEMEIKRTENEERKIEDEDREVRINEDEEEISEEITEEITNEELPTEKGDNNSYQPKTTKNKSKPRKNISITCKNHCVESLFQVNKVNLNPKPICPTLKLHKRTCCDSKFEQKLPMYEGLRSEYGLSSAQIQKRERRRALIRSKHEKRQELQEEFQKRRIQQNELIFCQWLREIAGREKGVGAPEKQRPKTAESCNKIKKERDRPHSTNCVYIKIPQEILKKGLRIGEVLITKNKGLVSDRLHILRIS